MKCGLWEKTVLGENRKKIRKNVKEARSEEKREEVIEDLLFSFRTTVFGLRMSKKP